MSICLRDALLLLTGVTVQRPASGLAARLIREQPVGVCHGSLSLHTDRVVGGCSFTNRFMFFPWGKNTLPCSLTGRSL